MEYNPLARPEQLARSRIRGLKRERTELREGVDWYLAFDETAVGAQLDALHERAVALYEDKAAVIRDKESAARMTAALETDASPGWNPTRWFSEERATAKHRLTQHHRTLQSLGSQLDALTQELAEAEERGGALRADEERYRVFDVDLAKSRVIQIHSELEQAQVEHDALTERKAALDLVLQAPVQELTEKLSRLSTLELEMSAAERKISELTDLDNQLSRASTSYDKAMIHQKCGERFGESRPRAASRHTNERLRQCKREADSVRRDTTKLKERIGRLAEQGSRDIRSLVIDGSNACYEGRQFIGLAALIPLCEALAQRLNVTVVFDASIRRRLGDDLTLAKALPGIGVHVVASRTKADETILQAAQDPAVFVLSNDRFAEFPEKAAVKERRIIRHEIVNGRVFVHELSVNVPFADTADTADTADS